MAVDPRHAAWQTKTHFAVRLLSESGDETELASGLADLADATEFALHWLDGADPARDGVVRLVIVRMDEAGAVTVWAYPPAPPTAGQELTERFGFDPTTWKPRIEINSRQEEPTLSLSGRRRDPAHGVPSKTAVSQPVDSRPSGADDFRAIAARPPAADESADRDWGRALERLATVQQAAARFAGTSWEDPFSRGLLIVGTLSLWLCLALLDPSFLVLTAAMASALWLRQRQQRSVDPQDDFHY